MGHLGAGWLERPEREREERTSLLLDAPVKNGDTVATSAAAGITPPARMWRRRRRVATDIQPDAGDPRSTTRGGGHRECDVPARHGTDTGIEEGSVDLILLVDVYHDRPPVGDEPIDVPALRPGGVVALVGTRERSGGPDQALHTATAEQSRLEFEAVDSASSARRSATCRQRSNSSNDLDLSIELEDLSGEVGGFEGLPDEIDVPPIRHLKSLLPVTART